MEGRRERNIFKGGKEEEGIDLHKREGTKNLLVFVGLRYVDPILVTYLKWTLKRHTLENLDDVLRV